MRKLFAFLVWLFSFWTWQDFFLRWLRRPASRPASGKTEGHLLSQEGRQESEFARFLSSLSEDGRGWSYLSFDGHSEVSIDFGGFKYTFPLDTDVEAGYGEFLEAVVSSEIVLREKVVITLNGDSCCKHVEAFANTLRQSGNSFRELEFEWWDGSGVGFAKCVLSILGNDAIQHLNLTIRGLNEEMGKELAMEFMTVLGVPLNLRILKSFIMDTPNLDGEGMEELLKPFQAPSSVLEVLGFISLTSDAQLEHLSGLLASSTSLKTLVVFKESPRVQKVFINGFNNIAVALCSNQSLESLFCDISSSKELKVLLDPLLPRNNNLQRNTTLKKLVVYKSIGGKEGIETLVDLIRKNTSLLELGFTEVDDFYLDDTQGIENVLAILEALKTNKSLRGVDFSYYKAVGGYKVLGAMMDLLWENQVIEHIYLTCTGLEESGDADYVYSALSKRKKMKLWDIVQSMSIVNPTFGRVFLCGEPFAGKTRLRMSMKQLKEFQTKEEIPNPSRIKGKIRNMFKTSKAPKLLVEDMRLERTHGIEVESVLCDGFGITIWDMAGQTDYHSFHELVMPNLSADGSSSMFLLMCNPVKRSPPSKRRCPSDN